MPLVHDELCSGCGRVNLFGLLLDAEPGGAGRLTARCFIKQDHQGIVALTFDDDSDYDRAEVGQTRTLPHIREELEKGSDTITANIDGGEEIALSHDFSEHEREILLAGGLLSYLRDRDDEQKPAA
jgi:hypothetical protein